MLPQDLQAAEAEALQALEQALLQQPRGRWTVSWRFEGLRLLPVVLRLHSALVELGRTTKLLFPDAGAAALACRDAPHLADGIADFAGERRRLQGTAGDPEAVLLAVAPGQADYEAFEQLCDGHPGAVVMVNGRLEDAAVGIGSVARERRRGFLAQWQAAYELQPLDGAALRRCFPDDWCLYREDADGFRIVAQFDQRPDGEQQAAALATEGGLGSNLRQVDAFLEGLRR